MPSLANVDLQVRLSEEVHRASRLRTPLSVVVVTAARWAGEGAAADAEALLLKTIPEVCRTTDLTYEDGGRVVAILPGARSTGAFQFAERLRAALPNLRLCAGVADLETAGLFSPLALLSCAEQGLARARARGLHVASAAQPEPPPTSDLALPTVHVEKSFLCPVHGWQVRARFARNGHWSLLACSLYGDQPPACDQHCVTFLEAGVPLESSWTAERTEPEDS